MGQVGATASSTILNNLNQISTSTEFQFTLETCSLDMSTFSSTSTQPDTTYNRPKSWKWDKWDQRLQRLSSPIYTRYLPLLSSRLLSRLAAWTWVPSQAPRPHQTELTIGQTPENGSSGSNGFTDYPDPSIPDIYLYWVPVYSPDLQLGPEYLPKHLDPTRQNLQ